MSEPMAEPVPLRLVIVAFSVAAAERDRKIVAQAFARRIHYDCKRLNAQLVGMVDYSVECEDVAATHRLEVALVADPDRRPTPRGSIARIVTAEALARLMREVEAR